ncbi:MAG: integration host factor subunit alpha [Actinobacteria bacterium]|uniref:Unannotated protein n=1 Tax=freshwater metagenome TaxID=449393 RepID=A0A6J6QUH0_9ZZZZ|nr:integration host factor subunit alpha [Actinomycetota bacterium]
MNHTDLRKAVAAATGLSGADADRAVTATLATIADALAARDKVTLPGFGTFETRERAARTGRNPQTGAALEIAASTSPAFKPATALKRQVAGG